MGGGSLVVFQKSTPHAPIPYTVFLKRGAAFGEPISTDHQPFEPFVMWVLIQVAMWPCIVSSVSPWINKPSNGLEKPLRSAPKPFEVPHTPDRSPWWGFRFDGLGLGLRFLYEFCDPGSEEEQLGGRMV